ncbi:hypothetical protein QBC46DRAFT_461874 [Diplogelasinospora grovesii]|uniref:Uncharacterized protein n=1 Tax=Diplogelasinospora grovesii TaxID=303347 RepID=A0AAN6S0Z7_9PEZI|nr:hypothetical protein QBC46DRAFT_461874 [Diplogelasinospora grovesii]
MATREKAIRHDSAASGAFQSTRSTALPPDQAYARKLQTHSQLSTESCVYSFSHYANLADFLNFPYDAKLEDDTLVEYPADSDDERYVIIDRYFSDEKMRRTEPGSFDDLKFLLEDPNQIHTGTLIFLRGHQPARWLNLIGATFSVDPEFYRRHLNFGQAPGGTESFSDSSLPSGHSHMIQISIATLGLRSTQQGMSFQDNHENLQALRDQSYKMINQYLSKLSVARAGTVSQGDSIVRDFALHDRQHFSISQEISIYVGSKDGKWLAIVWSDFGRNLGQCEGGPWLPNTLHTSTPMLVNYWPIVQHRPGLVLDRKAMDRLRRELLHKGYGQLLDARAMAHDVYYALTDVFRFAASSEAQFLDMAQALLRKEMNPALHSRGSGSLSTDKTLTMWNLVYNKQLIDQHQQRLTDLVEFMETGLGGASDWPRATDTPALRETADKAARLVLADYRYLVRRAAALSADYAVSMTTLMNAASVDESQKAIAQAEGVAKLTTLAFFFVPLSFTTGVFGMKFQELGQGDLRIWVWAVTAAGTLFLTFVGLRWFSLRDKLRRRVLSAVAGQSGVGRGVTFNKELIV